MFGLEQNTISISEIKVGNYLISREKFEKLKTSFNRDFNVKQPYHCRSCGRFVRFPTQKFYTQLYELRCQKCLKRFLKEVDLKNE